MDTFTKSYLEAALWTSTDESTPQGGEPLDKNYGIADFAPETLALMVADCERFQAENTINAEDWEGSGRYSAEEMAGHHFWLTRNGHGSGFWAGDWADEAGERLTAASKAYGELNLYVGDDGLIHGSNS